MRTEITLFFCLVGAVMAGYSSDRSPQRFAQNGQSDYDQELAARELASHESFYDDSEENYHTSDDEYDADGSPGYSSERSNDDDANDESPKYEGPLAQPPGYEANGQPLPVQDLPAVVAEKQKHFHLYAHGPHAGAVAHAQQHVPGQPWLKPVPGGYASPWVPIIVPLKHYQHHQPHHQQPFHYQNINYQG